MKKWSKIGMTLVAIPGVFFLISLMPELARTPERGAASLAFESGVRFDFNVLFKNSGSDSAGVYKPVPRHFSENDAMTFAALFGINGDSSVKTLTEDNYNYYISGTAKLLTVSKSNGRVEFTEYVPSKGIGIAHIDKYVAKELAERKIRGMKLPLNYSETSIIEHTDDNTYEVRFINTLEGKRNYAYYKSAFVDMYTGNVVKIVYYDTSFMKDGVQSIITVKQASRILEATAKAKGFPNYERNKRIDIDIKRIELSYILSDYKLVPAYRFAGELGDGTGYEGFVPAEAWSHD